MYLQAILLCCIGLITNDSYTQQSCGAGTFEMYKNLGIKKVEEYHYVYSSQLPCDSTPKRTLFFNEKGQMIKESFRERSNPYYSYKYNDEGFLIDIDTNGLFGYGSFGTEPRKDTLIENFITYETWFSIDTIRRLQQTVKFSPNDSLYVKTSFTYDDQGRILSQIISYKKNDQEFVVSNSTHHQYNEFNLIQRVIRKDEIEDQIIDVMEYKYFR